MRLKHAIVLVPFLLAGCVTDGLSPTQLRPICAALVGPIKYNTFDAKSRRYAADLLAMDIHQRNAVGQQLGCPQYKLNRLGILQ
jgi:hypothetical protein